MTKVHSEVGSQPIAVIAGQMKLIRDDFIPRVFETMRAEIPIGVDRQLSSERIWLVSHFLLKREPPGIDMRYVRQMRRLLTQGEE